MFTTLGNLIKNQLKSDDNKIGMKKKNQIVKISEEQEKTFNECDIQRFISFLSDIQRLGDQSINDLIKDRSINLYKQLKNERLKFLLEFYGYPEEIIKEHESTNIEKSEDSPKKSNEEIILVEKPKLINKDKRSFSLLKISKANDLERKEDNLMQIVPYTPSLNLNQKVALDIQRIRQGKLERDSKVLKKNLQC